uniref:estrogen receptor-like isoform X2 n=1 Tax=Myxine glutinosa TaxID=7769 RepID=UPI00358FC1E2
MALGRESEVARSSGLQLLQTAPLPTIESCHGGGRRASLLVPFLPGNSDSPHAPGIFSETSTSPSAGRGEADGVLAGSGSGTVLPVLSRSPQQPLLFLSPPTPPWLPQVPGAPASFQPFVYETHTWLPGRLSPQTLEIAPLYSDLRRRKPEASVDGLPGSSTTSPTSPPLHGDGPRITRETHFCAVCSDLASGYHYGVWSCEGCKAFFKRSIQGRTNYVCPATNQCTIDKNRRKSCQACRLRRCHEVGMVRDACQRERRAPCPTRKAEPQQIQKSVVHEHMENPMASKPSQAKDGYLNVRPSGPVKFANAMVEPLGSLSSEQFLTCLLNAEPPNMTCHHDVSRPFTAERLMMLLTNLADRELVHMIGWAKKVPALAPVEIEQFGVVAHPALSLALSGCLDVLEALVFLFLGGSGGRWLAICVVLGAVLVREEARCCERAGPRVQRRGRLLGPGEADGGFSRAGVWSRVLRTRRQDQIRP